ncbi:MAG: ferrochelatase [Planctomycetaceae bacterium]|nr:ferrochelatase [Planctomycetaceae bacterium]
MEMSNDEIHAQGFTVSTEYDAILLVSFGGPERREDVIPFLENVLRGKPVPRERLLEVAAHYEHMGGVSPINAQCRELMAALRPELDRRGIALPIYWGNRNWTPLLPDTLRQMGRDGVKRALAFFTSAYSSYSGCRQYRENIAAAQAEAGPDAPAVDKLRVFYNHPEFIAANVDSLRNAVAKLPAGPATLLFTAHSIPMSMANHCDYVKQLEETARLIAEPLDWPADRRQLVYQSRSGRPQDPWLEPDILDALRQQAERGTKSVIVAPIGFLSDHMEVLYDLDYEAKALADQLGLTLVRAATVGCHPRFVAMIGELIAERLGDAEPRAIGRFGPNHDLCPVDCCLYPIARPGPR